MPGGRRFGDAAGLRWLGTSRRRRLRGARNDSPSCQGRAAALRGVRCGAPKIVHDAGPLLQGNGRQASLLASLTGTLVHVARHFASSVRTLRRGVPSGSRLWRLRAWIDPIRPFPPPTAPRRWIENGRIAVRVRGGSGRRGSRQGGGLVPEHWRCCWTRATTSTRFR